MNKQRTPENTRFSLAVVVLIAAALLFLSGCASLMTPNSLSPSPPPAVTVSATLLPLEAS